MERPDKNTRLFYFEFKNFKKSNTFYPNIDLPKKSLNAPDH